MTPALIILATAIATALLLLDGRRSKRRHQEWRRKNGLTADGDE